MATSPIRVSATEPANPGGFPDPVFLLAPPRSYSTVAVALLAGHPSLYGLPETNLFTAETLSDGIAAANRLGMKSEQDYLIGLARAVAQFHEGSQDPVALRRGFEWIREHSMESPRQVMDHLLGLISPRIGVEKTPNTAGSNEALARCMRAYPNARYLHLVRHPISTQQSLLSLYNKILFSLDRTYQERVRWCLMLWYSSHLRIVQALRGCPKEQWMRVRAEDLVGQPRTWLPRILDWLDLDHDETIINLLMQTERWEFAHWNADAGFGGGDDKFLNAPKLRPIPPPSHELTDPEWDISEDARKRIIALARHLGY